MHGAAWYARVRATHPRAHIGFDRDLLRARNVRPVTKPRAHVRVVFTAQARAQACARCTRA
jgi:hypothetical protein